jgi:ABC-type branched-subunit amino acid transport system ATPase component
MPTSTADRRLRPPPHLAVSDLSAGYATVPIVEGVSFTVGAGEIVALLGPNGAGKSTVLKALVGSAKLMAGTVTLSGVDITGTPAHSLAGKGCGYVPQSRDVFDDLTVRENLLMGGYLLDRRQLEGRIEKVLHVFPALSSMTDRTARKLSGGERKMLAIARVMMLEPHLMILDEPTANLAPALAERLLQEQIRAVAATGTAVLLVEQKATAALAVADWAYLLVAGRIVRQGHPDDLLAQSDFAEAFLGASGSAANPSPSGGQRHGGG